MAQRRALGRGLSALIPPATPAAEGVAPHPDEATGPISIAVERIRPSRRQPRKRFDDSELDRLASSLREQGLLQPLVVRRSEGGYELIIGERRWRAAQRAGLSSVPAVVLEATDRGLVEMALVENVQRADLNPIELATAFRALVEEEGMTQDEVSQRVGLDRTTVANHIRLFDLPPEIHQDLVDGRLTMGHAKAILQAPPDRRVGIRDRIVRGGLSVRMAEEVARADGARRKKLGGNRPNRDVHLSALEERIQRELRTKVRLVGHRERGRIEIHFHGAAELERIADCLTGGDS